MNCDKIKQKTAGIVNYNRWQEEYDESVKSSDTCSGKRDTNEVGCEFPYKSRVIPT